MGEAFRDDQLSRNEFLRRRLLPLPLGLGVLAGGQGVQAGSASGVDRPERFEALINIKDHGARGDGGTDDSQALRSALSEAGHEAIVFPKGVYRLGGSVEVDSGQVLVMQPGARLHVSDDRVLTLRGRVAAGGVQVFEGSGAVRLLGNPAVDVRWFGAGGGGSDREAVQACLDAVGDGVSVVFSGGSGEDAGGGRYRLDGTLTLSGRRHVTFKADPGVQIELVERVSGFLEATSKNRS